MQASLAKRTYEKPVLTHFDMLAKRLPIYTPHTNRNSKMQYVKPLTERVKQDKTITRYIVYVYSAHTYFK